MGSLGAREWSDAKAAELGSRVESGERELARGRFDHPHHRPGADLPTGGHSYLLVTDRRILWVEGSIELKTVTGFTEITQFHRYAIRLRHAPVQRREWAPAHRVLWWRRGNATRPVHATETTFVFSHRDTKAVEAIRRRLGELGVGPGEPITMPRTRPRDEGKAYLQSAPTSRWRRALRT
jgi:hypothetical protein